VVFGDVCLVQIKFASETKDNWTAIGGNQLRADDDMLQVKIKVVLDSPAENPEYDVMVTTTADTVSRETKVRIPYGELSGEGTVFFKNSDFVSPARRKSRLRSVQYWNQTNSK